LLNAVALADGDVVMPIEPGPFLRGNPFMNHFRSWQLALALLACGASADTASANPGGMRPVVIPHVSAPPPTISYGHSGGTDAARSAVDAARGTGTGAMPFGPSVGGIENAPRDGSTGGSVPGKYGVWVNTVIGTGAPNPSSGKGGGDYETTDFLIDVVNESSTAHCTNSNCNHPNRAHGTGGSADPANSGSGTKVASTGPTTGTTSTTSLPGPTGGTTTTASVPGDPPDAKKPLTPAEHQALVDNATRLQNETNKLDTTVRDLTELVNRATDGTMTEAQKADLVQRGGIDAVNKQIIDTSNQSRATSNDAKNAKKEAQANDSYRHVQ
jgi:hypothetical protein